jgi:hypothetical protein
MTSNSMELIGHDVMPRQERKAGAGCLLSLAAAPTFATMALLTGIHDSTPGTLCSAAQDASPLIGMVPMYVLMSVFHISPWLRLLGFR